jgi:hypothetical protein
MTRNAFRTIPARSAVAVVALFGTVGLFLAGAGDANAAGSADLSVTQTITGSATSGHTGDTIAIHNAGPNDASTVSVVMLITTKSNSFSLFESGASCEFLPPPDGYQWMLTCQSPSLTNGSTLNIVSDLIGQAGVRFTMHVSVGENGPGDPNFGDNSSAVTSYFGPAADLAMTESHPTQTTPGQAQIVTNMKNNGPNDANSLQDLIEIRSSKFQSAGASSNISGASCTFVAPQPNFTTAISCTLGSLPAGVTWTMTITYHGGSGKDLNTTTTVSAASPADPALSNNTHKLQTKYA